MIGKRKTVKNQGSIIQAIQTALPPDGMTTKIIAIDGPGGAGKSSFAEQLSQKLGNAPILHTDDFASWPIRPADEIYNAKPEKFG